MIRDLLQDLRYGIRALRRSPGFAMLAVLSLAAGIGANAAIFSLVNAVYLRPLPVRDPRGLVLFADGLHAGLSAMPMAGRVELYSNPLYERLRADNSAFEGLAAQQSEGALATIRRVGASESGTDVAVGRAVSANYFDVLGVSAYRGRGFLPEDETVRRDNPVLVLSDQYWQRRFSRDPTLIGASLTVDRKPYTVVGVTAPGFTGPDVGEATDFWFPISAKAPPAELNPGSWSGSRKHRWLLLIGRIKPGTSLAVAEASVNVTLQQFLAEEAPLAREAADHPRVRIQLEPGTTGVSPLRPKLRAPLLALMVGVGLLLLIVCLNVSHLVLARAINRNREMSIRTALGATRARLIRQLLAEGLLLAALGVAVAALLTGWLTDGLLALAASGRGSFVLDVAPDARVLSFTALLTLGAAVLLGLVPAWQASRIDLHPALQATSHSVTGGSRKLVSRLLLASQVAFSLVLLVGAGLLAGSLDRLRAVDKGFDEDHILIGEIRPGLTGLDRARATVLYDDLLRRVTALPGVQAASLSDGGGRLVGGGRVFTRILLPASVGTPPQPREVGWQIGVVTPDYFDTMGMRVVLGRPLRPEDREGAPRVTVVNETLARETFAGLNVLGSRFRYEEEDFEVVGVVRDARANSLREEPAPTAYVSVAQNHRFLRSLAVRVIADPAPLADQVRRVVQESHPELPVLGVRTIRSQMDRSLMQERLLATLSMTFGLTALFLVCVGLFGVVSQWAAQRTREIGLRMALGATTGSVRWLVMRQAFAIVLFGVATGLPGALAASLLLKSFLFGLSPIHPPTIAAASLTMFAVATLAAYLPARRASSADPMTALRAE
jgi:predicted permease